MGSSLTRRSRSGQSTTHNTDTEADLKAAIDKFEAGLMSPVIPGGLASWIREVERTWNEVAAQILYQVKHVHPRQFAAIADQDPELLPRIDLLRAEDTAINEQREVLRRATSRIADCAKMAEPDDEQTRTNIQTLVDDGISFITRVRKQCVAVQTWYVEAFNRDHGAVD